MKETLNVPLPEAELHHERKKEIYPEVETIINENENLKKAIEDYREKCDKYTVGHIFGDANKSVLLGEYLDLDEEHKKYFIQAALLHDIGKTDPEISPIVKSQNGHLNQAEWEILQKHVRKSIEYAEKIGMPQEVLQIIGAHHEENNGKSYPRRADRRQTNENFAGEDQRQGERRQVPDEQIKKIIHAFSLIDRFDAHFSDRSYKSEDSVEKACQILKSEFNSSEDLKMLELLLEEREKQNYLENKELPN